MAFDDDAEHLIHARDTPLRRFFDSHRNDFRDSASLGRAKTTILEDIVHRLRNREYVRQMLEEVIGRHPKAIYAGDSPSADEKTKSAERARFGRLLGDALSHALLEANYPDVRDQDIDDLLARFSDSKHADLDDPRVKEQNELWTRTTIQKNDTTPEEVYDLTSSLRHALRERTYFKQIIDQASAKRLDVFRQRGNALEPRSASLKEINAFLDRLGSAYDGHLTKSGLEAWFDANTNRNGFRKVTIDSEKQGLIAAVRAHLVESRSKGRGLDSALDEFFTTRGARLTPTLVSTEDSTGSVQTQIRSAYERAVVASPSVQMAWSKLRTQVLVTHGKALDHSTREREAKAALDELAASLNEVRARSTNARNAVKTLRELGTYDTYQTATTNIGEGLGKDGLTNAIAAVASGTDADHQDLVAKRARLAPRLRKLHLLTKTVTEDLLGRLEVLLSNALNASTELERAKDPSYPDLAAAASALYQRSIEDRPVLKSLIDLRLEIGRELKALKVDIDATVAKNSKAGLKANAKQWGEFLGTLKEEWDKLKIPSWEASRAPDVERYVTAVRTELVALDTLPSGPVKHPVQQLQAGLVKVPGLQNAKGTAKAELAKAHASCDGLAASLHVAMTPAVTSANGDLPPAYRQDTKGVMDRALVRLRRALTPYVEGSNTKELANQLAKKTKQLVALPGGEEHLFSVELGTDATRAALAKNLVTVFKDYEDVLLHKESVLAAFFSSERIPFAGAAGKGATVGKVKEEIKAADTVAAVKTKLEGVFNKVEVLGRLKSTAANDDLVSAFRLELYHAFKDRIPEILRTERAVSYGYWWLTFYPKAVPLGDNKMEGQSIIEVSFPERVIPKEQYHRWLQDHVRNDALAKLRTRGESFPTLTKEDNRRQVASDTLTAFLTVMRAQELSGQHSYVLQTVVEAMNVLTSVGGGYEKCLNFLRSRVAREVHKRKPRTTESAFTDFFRLSEEELWQIRKRFQTRLRWLTHNSSDSRNKPKDSGTRADYYKRQLELEVEVEERLVELAQQRVDDTRPDGLQGQTARMIRSEAKKRLKVARNALSDYLAGEGSKPVGRPFPDTFSARGESGEKAGLEEGALLVEELIDWTHQHRICALLSQASAQTEAYNYSCEETVALSATWDREFASRLLATQSFGLGHVVLALRSAVEDQLPLPAKAELYLNAYFDGVGRFERVGKSEFVYPFPDLEQRFELRDFLRLLGVRPDSIIKLGYQFLKTLAGTEEVAQKRNTPEELLITFGKWDDKEKREKSHDILKDVRYRPDQAEHRPLRYLELWLLERELYAARAQLFALTSHGFYGHYPAVPDAKRLREQFLGSEDNLRALVYQWLRDLWISSTNDRAVSARLADASAVDSGSEKMRKEESRARLRGQLTRFLDGVPLTGDVRRDLVRQLSDPDKAKSMYAWLHVVFSHSRAMDQLKRVLLPHLYAGLWDALGELSESRRRPVSFPGLNRTSQYDQFLHWGRVKLQPGIQVIDLLPASRDDLVGISVNEGGVVARAAGQGEGAAAYDVNELALLQRNAQLLGKSLRQSGPGVAAVTTTTGEGRDWSQELGRFKTRNESFGYTLGGSARGSIYARARASMAYARRREYLDAVITAAGRGDNFAKWVVRKGDLRSDQAGTDAKKLVAAAHNGYPNGDQPFHLLLKVPDEAVHTDWRGRRYILFNSAYAATSRTPLEASGGWLGWLAKGFSYLLHPPMVDAEESWVVGTVYPFKWDATTFEEQQELLRTPNALGGRVYLDSSDQIHYSEVRGLIDAEAGFVKTTRALQGQHLSEVMKQIEAEASEEHGAARALIKKRSEATRTEFSNAAGN